MTGRLFVGNLSFQATEADLRELFEQVGAVQSVRIVTDPATGRVRGFAFVELASEAEAERAIEELHGRLFRDRNLVVTAARSQPTRRPEARGPAGRARRPGGPGRFRRG